MRADASIQLQVRHRGPLGPRGGRPRAAAAPVAGRPAGGFTLIELMIAVAIVAILVAVGYPSYRDHVQRGRIAEATGALSLARVRLEQYYQDNRNYGSTATACGVAMPTAGQSFTLACNWGAGATSQQFLVTATGTGTMTGFTYTVNHENAQRTTAFPGATVPANCWLVRKGATC